MLVAGAAAILLVFGETLLPAWARQTAETMLRDRGAESAEVTVESTPGILFLLGQIDTLKIDAKGLRIGDLRMERVQLTGSGVHFSSRDLFLDHRVHLISAEGLKLTGVVSEDALRNLLAKRIDKLDNIKGTIDAARHQKRLDRQGKSRRHFRRHSDREARCTALEDANRERRTQEGRHRRAPLCRRE